MKGKYYSVDPTLLLLYLCILFLSLLVLPSAGSGTPALLAPSLSLSSLTLLILSVLLGIAMYVCALVVYYAFLSEDVFLLHGRQDSLTLLLLRLVNPIRELLNKSPIWQVPGGIAEKEIVQLGIEWFSHIDQWQRQRHPLHGRAAKNKVMLRELARQLVANMVQALWHLQWCRQIGERMLELDMASSNRIIGLQEAERRERDRLNHSFEALVSLASRLAELGSQVDENELARLLDEFRETALQIEEDTLAWGEVRTNGL